MTAPDRTCATCQHWQPKKSGEMARHLFCRCAKGPAWQFQSPQSTCARHSPVAADVRVDRAAWIDKHNTKRAPA